MEVKALNDLNMNDSEILSINVDLSADGCIGMTLDYIESYHPFKESRKILRFDGCYRFSCNMHMDAIPIGTIIDGVTLTESSMIKDLKDLCKGRLDDIIPLLSHHQITTCTSASQIDILSRSVSLLDA